MRIKCKRVDAISILNVQTIGIAEDQAQLYSPMQSFSPCNRSLDSKGRLPGANGANTAVTFVTPQVTRESPQVSLFPRSTVDAEVQEHMEQWRPMEDRLGSKLLRWLLAGL